MNITKGTISALIAIFVLFLATAIDMQGQIADKKAKEILDKMQRAYEKSIEKVDDYVMVTNIATYYYKKAFKDGKPYFKSRTEMQNIGSMRMAGADDDFNPFDPAVFSMLQDNAQYKGTEKINGFSTHILYIDEISELGDKGYSGAETLKDVFLYIDTDQWIIRQINAGLEIVDEKGTKQTLTSTMQMKDYRLHEGMPVAYQTLIHVDGFMSNISEKEREEARKNLAEMERELTSMPPDQRRMVENMMGESLEQMRRMAEGESLEFKIEVKEVKVNTGMKDF